MGGAPLGRKANVMHKSLLALFQVSVIVLLSSSAHGDTLDQIRERGALRWGGDASGGGPYIYQGPDNQLTGFEFELAEYLADELGVRSRVRQLGMGDAAADSRPRHDRRRAQRLRVVGGARAALVLDDSLLHLQAAAPGPHGRRLDSALGTTCAPSRRSRASAWACCKARPPSGTSRSGSATRSS